MRGLSFAVVGALLIAVPAGAVTAAPLPTSVPFSDPQVSVTTDDQDLATGHIRTTYTVDGTGIAGNTWSLTNTLAEGLIVASPANAEASCATSTISADSGGNSISLSGASDEECTFSVDVTTKSHLENWEPLVVYKNCGENFSELVGVRLDADCALFVFRGGVEGSILALAAPVVSGINIDQQGELYVEMANHGKSDFTEEYPMSVTVDLTEMLDDGVFDSAEVAFDLTKKGDFSYVENFDEVVRDGNFLTWSGPLAVNKEVVMTIKFTMKATGDGSADITACMPGEITSPGRECSTSDEWSNQVSELFFEPSGIVANDTLVVGEQIELYWTFQFLSHLRMTDVGVDIVSVNGLTDGSANGVTPVITDCPTSMEPDSRGVCSSTYTIVQADVDRGSMSFSSNVHGTVNGAVITAYQPLNARVAPRAASSMEFLPRPRTTIEAYRVDNRVGEEQTFVYELQNTGDTKLSNFEFSQAADMVSGGGGASAISCPTDWDGILVPNETVKCSATATGDLDDVLYGNVMSAPGATATSHTGASVANDAIQQLTAAALRRGPTIQLGQPYFEGLEGAQAGDTLRLVYSLRNAGVLPLVDIVPLGTIYSSYFVFTGDNPRTAPSCDVTTLAAGETAICGYDYVLTKGDLDRSYVLIWDGLNVTSQTVDPSSRASRSTTDPILTDQTEMVTTVNTVLSLNPAKSLSENATASTEELVSGEVVDLAFDFANDGNTTLSSAAFAPITTNGTGVLSTPECTDVATLNPGDSVSCTATYTVTDEDVVGGSVELRMHASAMTPDGGTVRTDLMMQRLSAPYVEPAEPMEPAEPVTEPTVLASVPEMLARTGSAAPFTAGIAVAVLLALGISFMIRSRKRLASEESELISE